MEQEQLSYRIVIAGGTGEVEEKKSRFIANVRPVHSEEEAQAFWDEMKKKYWDARHNCYASVLGKRGELARCSDDGEPGGTAGRPMLEVLAGQGLTDVAVVVTRYFGGTLLGTGGLARAYTQAVQEALKHCVMGRMRYGAQFYIQSDYNGLGKIQYVLGKYGMKTLETVYTEKVRLKVLCPFERKNSLMKELMEATAGKACIEDEENYYFVDKEESV